MVFSFCKQTLYILHLSDAYSAAIVFIFNQKCLFSVIEPLSFCNANVNIELPELQGQSGGTSNGRDIYSQNFVFCNLDMTRTESDKIDFTI